MQPEKIRNTPPDEVPKVPKPPFVTFVTPPGPCIPVFRGGFRG